MAEERDHYQVLGISPGADPEEIRRAHRKLVRALHPDRHVEATAAEQQLAERRMREINDAWHTLRDPARRRSYDATRVSAKASSPRPSTGRPTHPSAPRRNPPDRASPRPGPSTAGNGAYWDSRGTDRSNAPFSPGHARPAPSNPDGGIRVPAGTAMLLRRGPLLVGLAVVIGLFVVTAYITGGNGGETRDVIPPPLGACVVLEEQSSGFLVDCAVPNDGEVVAQVEAPLDCPTESRYVQVGSEFFCIPIPLGG